MKRENLRKVKWVKEVEYFYGDKKLTEKQAYEYMHSYSHENLIKEIGEENYKSIKLVRIYGYGYFHQWVVENYGNSHEGFSTYVYALIESEDGEVSKFKYDSFTFID